MPRLIFLFMVVSLVSAAPARSDEWQSLSAIQQSVSAFVQQKLAAESGERTVTVSRIDPRLKLSPCTKMEAYLPGGNRLWGNSSIGVRCLAPGNWNLYVPVTIRVSDHVLVAARPIASKQEISVEDVKLQFMDITQFAGSVLTNKDQVAGMQAVAPLAAGSIIRSEQLRAAKVIRQGQTVQVVAHGNGFQITSEGMAMGNAVAGQMVAVKTTSGEIVKGIATSEGTVEVRF